MKHQYFGDVNDFRKYGLLQVLCSAENFRLGICWMLTPDDLSSDGLRIDYLSNPKKWRTYSPDLFDLIAACVASPEKRALGLAAVNGFLPRAQFYSGILPDSSKQRQDYFTTMMTDFAKVDLVFFDPDNGLEIRSVQWGRKMSSKYLYWREVSATYKAGHSLLIYQHFPRKSAGRSSTNLQ